MEREAERPAASKVTVKGPPSALPAQKTSPKSVTTATRATEGFTERESVELTESVAAIRESVLVEG